MGLVTPAAPVPVSELGRVHFVGIGGAGMSGIARILLARGVAVSGSDSGRLGAARRAGRARRGGRTWATPRPTSATADTVVTTSIGDQARQPRARRGRRRGHQDRAPRRPCWPRSCSASRASRSPARTARPPRPSMVTTVLRQRGADPGYVIGGILAETGPGADDGAGDWFVAEADESDGSFVMLAPGRRSSPASRPTTWTTTAAWPRSRRASPRSRAGSATAGCSSRAATTPGPPRCAADRGRVPDPGAHLRRVARGRLPGHRRAAARHGRPG